MRKIVFGGLLCLCALLCSCATWQRQEGMDVALVNVRLAEATLWESTASFTVRLSNETSESLICDGSVHKFYLDGAYVGDGMTNERVQVPRLSSVTQEITVHLRNVALATRIRPILEARSVEYRVNSTLYLVDSSHSRRCRVTKEGRLDSKDFAPSSPREAKSQ